MSPEMAAIVGAVGGALVALVGTVYEGRRRERREAKAAARGLLVELGEARRSIAFALGENDWSSLVSQPPRLGSWERVSQGFAASVRAAVWRKVSAAARAAELVADVAKSVGGPRRIFPDADPDAPGDADRTELVEAQREIEEAILVLGGTSKFRDEQEAIELDRALERQDSWLRLRRAGGCSGPRPRPKCRLPPASATRGWRGRRAGQCRPYGQLRAERGISSAGACDARKASISPPSTRTSRAPALPPARRPSTNPKACSSAPLLARALLADVAFAQQPTSLLPEAPPFDLCSRARRESLVALAGGFGFSSVVWRLGRNDEVAQRE